MIIKKWVLYLFTPIILGFVSISVFFVSMDSSPSFYLPYSGSSSSFSSLSLALSSSLLSSISSIILSSLLSFTTACWPSHTRDLFFATESLLSSAASLFFPTVCLPRYYAYLSSTTECLALSTRNYYNAKGLSKSPTTKN